MSDRARLSAFDLGCVVVGGIVGVGIFFTPAEVARRVDSPTQLVSAWALGGAVAALGALVFAELACRRPGHGGTWRYLHAAFGPRIALLFAWANGCVIQAGALGVIGLVLADHLDLLLHGAPRWTAWTRLFVAAAAVASLAGVNAAGLRVGRSAQNLFTVAKCCALLGLVALGASALGGSDAPLPAAATAAGAAPRGWMAAIPAAMLPVLFAIGGWQSGTFVAGAAARPMRDVPLGLTGGVAFVIVAYLAVNLALLELLGLPGMAASGSVAADAAGVGLERFGLTDVAARGLAAAVVVSAIGVLNTICLAPPYVLSSLAQEGLLPARLAGTGRHGGAPLVAILVQAGTAVALLLAVAAFRDGDPLAVLGFLLDGVVFVDWIFYGLCGVALLRLRRGGPSPGFAAPCGRAAPALFTLAALAVAGAAVVVSPAASAAGAAACAPGLLLAWHAGKRRR